MNDNALTAGILFECLCPLRLLLEAELCRELGGRYGFRLSGSGGGEWALDFDRQALLPIVEGADVILEMSAEDFEGLLNGTLDGAAASASGKLGVEGDARLLDNFCRFAGARASQAPRAEARHAA